MQGKKEEQFHESESIEVAGCEVRAKAVNEEIIEQSRQLRIESNWELATRSAAAARLLLCDNPD